MHLGTGRTHNSKLIIIDAGKDLSFFDTLHLPGRQVYGWTCWIEHEWVGSLRSHLVLFDEFVTVFVNVLPPVTTEAFKTCGNLTRDTMEA